jgi:hypothetical protein
MVNRLELVSDGWCPLQGAIAQVVVAAVGFQSHGMGNCADRMALRQVSSENLPDPIPCSSVFWGWYNRFTGACSSLVVNPFIAGP